MRCPYCGGLNREQSTYCVSCGRALQNVPPQQPAPLRTQWPGVQPPQARPVNVPNQAAQRTYAPVPNQQARPSQNYAPSPQRPAAQPAQQQTHTSRRQQGAPIQEPAFVVAAPPPAPEPPVPFPPHTMEQLRALLSSGAQPYTIVESTIADGRKKIVRIAYANVTGWQQAATLLKALQEQQEEQYNTIIIQGVTPRQQDVYAFTNGQLQFDRAVRLGGSTSNRYVIETDNGFASDSVRFVLNE